MDLTLDGQLQHGTGLGPVPGGPEPQVPQDCLFLFGFETCSDIKHESDQLKLIISQIGQGDPMDLTLDGHLQHGPGHRLVPEPIVPQECLFNDWGLNIK